MEGIDLQSQAEGSSSQRRQQETFPGPRIIRIPLIYSSIRQKTIEKDRQGLTTI